MVVARRELTLKNAYGYGRSTLDFCYTELSLLEKERSAFMALVCCQFHCQSLYWWYQTKSKKDQTWIFWWICRLEVLGFLFGSFLMVLSNDRKQGKAFFSSFCYRDQAHTEHQLRKWEVAFDYVMVFKDFNVAGFRVSARCSKRPALRKKSKGSAHTLPYFQGVL